jgi:hypothetical protein
MFVFKVMWFIRDWFIGILYSIDQLANKATLGSPDHTISGRVGYSGIKGRISALVFEVYINAMFFWQDNHCRNAIEYDEVKPYNGPVTGMLVTSKRVLIPLGIAIWVMYILAIRYMWVSW